MPKKYIELEAAIIGLAASSLTPHQIDDAAEALQLVPAADVVEVVRCRECIHRPSGTGVNHDVKFPDDACPCQCPDPWYSWVPPDDWYCASGERKYGGQDDV